MPALHGWLRVGLVHHLATMGKNPRVLHPLRSVLPLSRWTGVPEVPLRSTVAVARGSLLPQSRLHTLSLRLRHDPLAVALPATANNAAADHKHDPGLWQSLPDAVGWIGVESRRPSLPGELPLCDTAGCWQPGRRVPRIGLCPGNHQ
jgi:hypothetical protein